MTKIITLTEFRKNASRYFSAVEKGETITVLRYGKPVAQIKPIFEKTAVPSWKNPGLRLATKGADLSAVIMEERKFARME